MSVLFAGGLVVVVGGFIHMALVARQHGPAWEYMTGLALVEVGLGMTIGSLMPPGLPRTGVGVLFLLAVASTTYMEQKGRQAWEKAAAAQRSS